LSPVVVPLVKRKIKEVNPKTEGNNHMKITINCYIDEAKKPRFLVVKERINFEIMKVLETEGIELYTNNIRIKNFDPEMLNGRKNEEKKYIKGE